MFFTYLLYIHASSFEPKETTENFTKPKYFYTNVPGAYKVELPPGLYKVTCCGAQGGVSCNRGSYGNCGGYGACVSGYMKVNGSNQIFYAVIGGMGGSNPKGLGPGGFNGGGTSGLCRKFHYHLHNKQYNNGPGGGGGATDLRYMSTDVSSRIIVAAGGSGASVGFKGADGGDLNGRNFYGIATRISQDSGNWNGQGSNGNTAKFYPSSGAGGGYRGGLPGVPSDYDALGAISDSGSSYISGYPGCSLYENFNFTEGEMKVGANTGNGYLVIDQKYPCSSNCIHCLNETECLVCEEGYRLYNGVCFDYCPFGVIDRETYCENCVPECSSCSGNIDNCSSCNNGYYLFNNKCYQSCPNGTYINGSYCNNCSISCHNCDQISTNCTDCPEKTYFFKNKCFDKCPERTVPYESICIPECSDNRYLYNLICYDKCPIGTYEDGIICSECSSNCEECKDNANKCTKCAKGMYLFDSNCTEKCPDDYPIYNDECVEKCPKGFYMDYNDGLCEKCDSSCATCQYFPTECTSCNENMFLFKDQCITECPKNTLIFKNECVFRCPEGYIPVLGVCEEDSIIINYVFIERHEKKSKYSLKKIDCLLYTSIGIFVIEVIALITIGICYYKKSKELQ